MITIGIIEDDATLRASLELMIRITPELRLLFSCNSFEKWIAVSASLEEKPYMVFLDIGLPGISGLKAISVIKKEYPDTHLVMITGDSSNEMIWEAISNGANGYLLKPFTLDELRQQIQIVRSGGAAISPHIAGKLIRKINTEHGSAPERTVNNIPELTRRESDVVEQLIKGLTYKEVSQILRISITTVNDHIKNIYTKLGVNSKAELISKVLKNKPPDKT
jgi:DNA-binding NarL/FixJ family response regulator